MRVVHLSTTDVQGGAARGAYWLHRALANVGVDSQMLVGRKYSDDDSVHSLSGFFAPMRERVRNALDHLPLRTYQKTEEAFWTVGWLPRRVKNAVAALKPDLVHLHWTGGGFMPIDALATLPYPLVWTLRDMWAFTGGCHYTAGCDRYEVGCGQCPQLRSLQEDDLSRVVWRRKHDTWDRLDLWLVPISNWLAECAKRSLLFNKMPIKVIPNGVDSRRFRPVSRARARAVWNLDPTKRCILFGALGAVQDDRKGFPQLIEAMRELGQSPLAESTELIVFGDLEPDASPAMSLPVRFLGRIDNDEHLAMLYAAADVMVVPSLQEAFGKTLIEAMACGTPVVAFAGGGPSDIVVHRETGYLADPGDPVDLARGIVWCLEDPDRTKKLGKRSRARIEESFDINVVADKYRSMYFNILARAP